MTPRPIKSKAEHKRAKDELQRLMTQKLTKEVEELIELYSLVIEDYEKKQFALPLPDPIDAIRLRMEQQGLTIRDLEPLIGTRSRVSEVLSGKRPLSLDMVRALSAHLGVPAQVLIQKPETKPLPRLELSAAQKNLLVKRKMLAANESLADLVARAGSESALPAPLFRRELTERANARTNTIALLAWTAAVIVEAARVDVPVKFKGVDANALRSIAQLSARADWYDAVRKQLLKLGIILVVMPHLPETYVDGASLRRPDGVPVVALTLRHDRLDNFWFVLLHELSHIALHFSAADATIAFFDDLEIEGVDNPEREADQSAREALIPSAYWINMKGRLYVSAEDIVDFARSVGVHPSIVAGRIRRESGDYRRYAALVGSGEVRRRFPEYRRRIAKS